MSSSESKPRVRLDSVRRTTSRNRRPVYGSLPLSVDSLAALWMFLELFAQQFNEV